jgi:uncharacterized protein YycO
LVFAAVALAAAIYVLRPRPGVIDKYDDLVQPAVVDEAALSERMSLDARMLVDVLTEVDVIEAEMNRMNEQFKISKNKNAGLYTVEQERHISQAYGRYLVLRKALFHIAFRHKDFAEIADQRVSDQSFLLAYGSGLTLYRNAVMFVVLFKDNDEARRKLNEADASMRVPAGMFDEMYANITNASNVQLVVDGVGEYHDRRQRLAGSSLLDAAAVDRLLARLDKNEKELEGAYALLAEGKRDLLWTNIRSDIKGPAYHAQSFISMMVSHVKTPLAAEGLSPESIQRDVQPSLKPGDILLTRRDGYLSNTFLPGHWGHAALYVGTPADLAKLGGTADLSAVLKMLDRKDDDGLPVTVVEAIGEGVRPSSLEHALNANLLGIIRPKVDDEGKRVAIVRATKLLGTPYDFSFDLSSQDKIICTELVYRAYAPHLEVPFEEVMGTMTLKPDGMLKALSPALDDAKTEFVIFGRAVKGELEAGGLDEMVATVQ